jgi:hypothetical protein
MAIRGGAAFAPTDEQRRMVEAMAGFDIPEDEIRRVLTDPRSAEPIDIETLRTHFRTELDTGRTRANARVAESLFKKALGEGPSAVSASIFWLKARAGWKETNRVDLHHGLQDSLTEVLKEIDGRSRGLPTRR